jgi:hypothetical protein
VALSFALAQNTFPAPAFGQGLSNEIIYSRLTAFRIPFDTDPGQRQIQQIQLYFSTDQGQNWQPAGTATPAQRGFDFRADRDGLYWFAVRTVDFQNLVNPPTLQGLRPQLKVCVDTQPPVVSLRQSASRDGSVSVDWQIREENLDLSSFALEYRTPANPQWIPLAVTAASTGQYAWNPGTTGAVEVRLHVRDLAKNDGEDKLTIMPGSQPAQGGQGQTYSDQGQYTGNTQPGSRYVNSKQIGLNYSIEESGPSGIEAIELWVTRDGQTWARLEEFTPNSNSPTSQNEKITTKDIPINFTVQDEGVYGFTLVPRSGAGLKDHEPRRGEQPQIWVDVDTTKPVVTWLHVEVGKGQNTGKLFITWKAYDPVTKGSDKEKDLGREAITLKYATSLNDPWNTIVEKQPNTGSYEWKMPAEGQRPVKFFVRLEVTDKAGNVETQDTPKPINVDLKVPRGKILDARPGGR